MKTLRASGIVAAIALGVVCIAVWTSGRGASAAGATLILAGCAMLVLTGLMTTYYRAPIAFLDVAGQLRKNVTPAEDPAFERRARDVALLAGALVLAAGIGTATVAGLAS